MRILVISQMFPCKRHPTSAIFLANLLKELATKLTDLIVITPRPYIPKFMTKFNKSWDRWYLDPMITVDNNTRILRPYFLYLRGTSYSGLNGILMQYSLVKLIKKIIAKQQVDIILGFNLLPDGIAAERLAKKFKLPVVIWCIGSDINDSARYNALNYYLAKKCLEESQLILTTSKDLENTILSYNLDSVNVKTFYRGIDLSTFQDLPSKEDISKELHLDSKKKYMLFVGRLIYDKGIYELAHTFNTISKRNSNLNLILIGEELEKEKLEAKFREYGILDRVRFTGVIPYPEIANYMKASDLLVLPSWAEGLPNVVMEAMATGLPVIATDVGGIPEILKNGVTGISVPAKNAEKLTEAVIEMMDNETLREECIRNAKELMKNNFDVKKNVHVLYEMLLEMKNNYIRSN